MKDMYIYIYFYIYILVSPSHSTHPYPCQFPFPHHYPTDLFSWFCTSHTSHFHTKGWLFLYYLLQNIQIWEFWNKVNQNQRMSPINSSKLHQHKLIHLQIQILVYILYHRLPQKTKLFFHKGSHIVMECCLWLHLLYIINLAQMHIKHICLPLEP